jgi:uncharacterized protein YbjQ (UPF0145 family)
MKLKDVAAKNGIKTDALEAYIRKSSIVPFKDGFSGISIDDSNVETLVNGFTQHLAEEAQKKAAADKAAAEKAAAEKKAADDKKRALANMLVTSGFNFDGYTIKKYSGYISGDDAVQIPRGQNSMWNNTATDVGAALMESLVKIRRTAIAELKEAAYALGCNAVIGVDFDYITLDPEVDNGAWTAQNARTVYLPYVFGVTANGNAVIIEKNEIE